MEKIPRGFIVPSGCYTLSPKHVRWFKRLEQAPKVGDVVYGKVSSIGEHSSLENKQGRLHTIYDGSRAVFVFANRYAPDYYEAIVPEKHSKEIDLIARSGLVGRVRQKNALVKDPTQIEILGNVVDEAGTPVNTLNHPLIEIKRQHDLRKKRSKMILNVGTSMNSGKSTTAKTCCWALASMGYVVRGAKVTGTASLKDVLLMQDAGAEKIADFSHLGYPSTYLVSETDAENIFKTLDLKFANNPKNYWVVEIADGIMQRETAMLLRNEYVRKRIHKLIFSAGDAQGALGGVRMLKREFDLEPHAISGRCTSSPLGISELKAMTDIPVIDNMIWDLKRISEILL